MTIDQAIHTVDELKPNQIERARKIDWLSQLDRKIYRELICTHERKCPGEAPRCFHGYTQDTDPDTVLLAPPPYDEMYRYYLEMHIDLVNLEYEKYNNSAVLHAAAWRDFASMWMREHKPLETEGAHFQF